VCSFLSVLLLLDALTDLYDLCRQEGNKEIRQIPYSELTDLKAIGEGGYAVAYKAKHGRFGTVVYKELNTRILNDRYARYQYKQWHC